MSYNVTGKKKKRLNLRETIYKGDSESIASTSALALKVILKFGEDPKVAGRKIRTIGRMRQNIRESQALQCFLSFVACVRTSIAVVQKCLFIFASALQSGPLSL